jgi:predicted transcriptional regulator of viral defense system
MRKSQYAAQLQDLLQRPSFSIGDAAQLGIPRHALAHFVKTGMLERVYKGVYRSSHYELKVDFEWENLAQVAASIPDGVICLISALCYYNLTDEIMREAWIAVPHRSYAPRRPHTRIVRMRNIELGRTEIQLGEFKLRIFDRERTIVDAFRYLGIEIAIKAIKRYMADNEHRPDLRKLSDYARALRVNLTPYILLFTT